MPFFSGEKKFLRCTRCRRHAVCGDEVRGDPADGTDNVGDGDRENPVGRFVSKEAGLIEGDSDKFHGFFG